MGKQGQKKLYIIRKFSNIHHNEHLLSTNKRTALRICKERNCDELRALSWAYYRECNYSMDFPTMLVMSDVVWSKQDE